MGRHVQAGSIKRHVEDVHNTKPSKTQLLNKTIKLKQCNSRQNPHIKDALLLLQNNPIINMQYDNFSSILKLYKSRNPNQMNNHHPIPSQSLPLTSHQVSPHINSRIEQLLSNARNDSSESEPASLTIHHTPISSRLRRSVRLISLNNNP